MRFSPGSLKGVVLIEPEVRKDSRGFFLEFYRENQYKAADIKSTFVQDNHSKSNKDTLRGLHAQLRHPQGKLIRVIQGEIFDVAVDARPDSPTFGRWEGQNLSSDNFRQLFIPAGFLHGFCVLSDSAEVEYRCTDYYDPQDEIGVCWNDPTLGIRWPLSRPLLSDKDKSLPTFKEITARLESYRER